MKRIVLALAIASLSFATVAAPPPGGGPPMPVDVSVTNTTASPVPVSVVPGMLPSVAQIGSTSLTLDTASQNTVQIMCRNIATPMRITGVSVFSSGVAAHAVNWNLSLKPIGSTTLSDEVTIAWGIMESRVLGPYLNENKAAMTLPVDIVTPGYDRLCIQGQRSGTDPVFLVFMAVGEAL